MLLRPDPRPPGRQAGQAGPDPRPPTPGRLKSSLLTVCVRQACLNRSRAAPPLPGCTRLEDLSGHIFRDGLHSAGRIGMSKIHKTWGFDWFSSRICSALSGFISVSSLQTKSDELKTGNRGAGKPFGGFCRIIRIHMTDAIDSRRRNMVRTRFLLHVRDWAKNNFNSLFDLQGPMRQERASDPAAF